MAELSSVVMQRNQEIREAEGDEDFQKARELWREVEQAVEQAQEMEMPLLNSYRAMYEWRMEKSDVFLQAHLHANRYGTPEWEEKLKQSFVLARGEVADLMARKRKAEEQS